uniref:X2-like carbohydrate binding domain-containing protein n=1 Tax=Paenibacillus sinopodophylli TaxID=1837342 RepID=UPI00110CB7FE
MTKSYHASVWPRIGMFMLAFIIMFQVSIPSIYAAPTPDSFTTKSWEDLPTKAIKDAAYGNNVYIAVGDDGAVVKSVDANHWVKVKGRSDSNYIGVSDPSAFSFLGVAYGNGLFVAVGLEGVILTSPDGDNWTQRNAGGTFNLSAVEYLTFNGTGAFYALAVGKYVTSTDGINWTSVIPTGLPADKPITQVTVGNNGTRLAFGSYEGKIYSTTNGSTWTNIQPINLEGFGANGANVLKWMNDRYLFIDISGYIWTSTNLTTFTQIGHPSKLDSYQGIQMRNALYDGTHYYLFGYESGKYGVVYTSTDTVSWAKQPFEREITTSNAEFINGKYFVFGNEGMSISDTGSNWSYKWGGNFNDVIYDGSKYIAVGKLGVEGSLWASNDLSNWTKQTFSGSSDSFTAAAYGNGIYVAVAGPLHNTTKIAASSNGTSWSLHDSVLGNETLTDVTFGNGRFVAVGNATSSQAIIETSTNGTTWSAAALPVNYIQYMNSVTYVNNQFIAIGYSGSNGAAILTSTDGVTWVDHSDDYPESSDTINNIIYDGSKYIVNGYDANNYLLFSRTSTNLGSWSAPSFTSAYPFYGSTTLAAKGSNIYMIGSDNNGNGVLFFSADQGTTWHDTSIVPAEASALAVVNVNNEVVIAGANKLSQITGVSVTPSAISPSAASFDKETAAQADVAVMLTLNGNTLSTLTNGAATLTAGTDYTVVG